MYSIYNTPYIRVTGEKSFEMSNWRNEKKRNFINPFRKIIVSRFPDNCFFQNGLEERNKAHHLWWAEKMELPILLSVIDNSLIFPNFPKLLSLGNI